MDSDTYLFILGAILMISRNDILFIVGISLWMSALVILSFKIHRLENRSKDKHGD